MKLESDDLVQCHNHRSFIRRSIGFIAVILSVALGPMALMVLVSSF